MHCRGRLCCQWTEFFSVEERGSQWTAFCSFTPCREMTFVLYSIFSWEDQLLAYVTSTLPFLGDIFLKAYMDRFQNSVIQIQLLLIVWMCCGCENRNCSCGCVKVHLVFSLMQCCYMFLPLCCVSMYIHIYAHMNKRLQWSFTNSTQPPVTDTDLQRIWIRIARARFLPLLTAAGLRARNRQYIQITDNMTFCHSEDDLSHWIQGVLRGKN